MIILRKNEIGVKNIPVVRQHRLSKTKLTGEFVKRLANQSIQGFWNIKSNELPFTVRLFRYFMRKPYCVLCMCLLVSKLEMGASAGAHFNKTNPKDLFMSYKLFECNGWHIVGTTVTVVSFYFLRLKNRSKRFAGANTAVEKCRPLSKLLKNVISFQPDVPRTIFVSPFILQVYRYREKNNKNKFSSTGLFRSLCLRELLISNA